MKLLLLLCLLPITIWGFPAVNDGNLLDDEEGNNPDVSTRSGSIFEGDMRLSQGQLAMLKHSNNGRTKRFADRSSKTWPDNTVYFYFARGVDQRTKNSVNAAHEYISSRTCVEFVESSTAKNRIKVFKGNGCYSDIGMKGGEQELSLGSGCQLIGVVIHEFMHALGFLHTQHRSDRDDFIDVQYQHISPISQGLFGKNDSDSESVYTPYEYGSVMHYGANFEANKTGELSIIPLDYDYLYTMGNRMATFYDMKMINEHYKCNEICPDCGGNPCDNGGYPNPNNCDVCVCPSGYAGVFCHLEPLDCGETLAATREWQTAEITVGDANNLQERDTYSECNSWITAPEGKQIELILLDVENSGCQYGCDLYGIEFKTESAESTNPRYCCSKFNNKVINSSLNPTPIIAYNRKHVSTFTYGYRYIDDQTVDLWN